MGKTIYELTKELEQGVKDIYKSEKYKNHLEVMSKFHRYSARNQILIKLQNPKALLVKGYNAWNNDFGRYVKKGEKGIEILARTPYYVTAWQEKLDENGDKVIDENGNPVKEKVKIEKEYYKKVTVFDISQTDGKEIKNLHLVEDLKFDVENFKSFFNALKEISPVSIEMSDIPNSNAKGYYSPNENKIVIRENMAESQTLKTLIHEIAHSILHNNEAMKNRDNTEKNYKEVEAESIAYVVSRHLGIDTSDYSFSYIASWSEDKEIKELLDSLKLIQKTSKEIIEKLDEKLGLKVELEIENNLTNKRYFTKEEIERAKEVDLVGYLTSKGY